MSMNSVARPGNLYTEIEYRNLNQDTQHGIDTLHNRNLFETLGDI